MSTTYFTASNSAFFDKTLSQYAINPTFIGTLIQNSLSASPSQIYVKQLDLHQQVHHLLYHVVDFPLEFTIHPLHNYSVDDDFRFCPMYENGKTN